MLQPVIIQGGMGVAVSGWHLARVVSSLGQLGVVSGTALGVVLARRLQLGDPGGEMRHALSHFPFPEMAARVLKEHFIPGGKKPDAPFRLTAMPTVKPRAALTELTVAANFVEVFLAKQGHSGPVGINFLEKIQLPTLPSIYGALLAGVDYILMGAGIPRSIPGVLDLLATGQPASLRLDVHGALPNEAFTTTFDPQQFCNQTPPDLKRPQFLGIVSSATLAMTLAKKANGRVDGFIVEGPTAGGHNAPPRGPLQLTASGEPLYGERDIPELDKIRALGLPFWMAGGYGTPSKVAEALSIGAAGVQVGTPFAFCEESGVEPALKNRVLQLAAERKISVFTDPLASPTGFPFKVAQLGHTMSEAAEYEDRSRICDLGYLRHLYRRTDGEVGYRCPAEPIDDFIRKGGTVEQTVGRKCVCNGLPATVGLEQPRADGKRELPLVTAGDDLVNLAEFLPPGRLSFSAAEVIRKLLQQVPSQADGAATAPSTVPNTSI
jgi:NAD(P)H-dependent flavin oxidoreductase YrpB (nitropropane dioxygenase family)